jgi:hypothetical protein
MNYERFSADLQQQLEAVLPLMPAQIRRIVVLCRAIYLTARIHLSFIARCLPMATQQDSRIRWISRLLQARFMRQPLVYQPVLLSALAGLKLKEWYLMIDRTHLVKDQTDLVTICLYYHRRAIPLIWKQVAYGGVKLEDYVDLVQQCAALIPSDAAVIFQGDVEFGGADMIRALRQLGWDFILAQRQHVHFRRSAHDESCALSTLPVTRHQTCQIANVDLFAQERIGAIQIVAFWKREYDADGRLRREICYLATSLPLRRNIRQLGARRFGIEPFHRDYKSSGWQLDQSHLQSADLREGLLIGLALCYLLSVCLGRWLCKAGKRAYIDNHPKRQLSLFRLGWDLIVHHINGGIAIPFRLCLYS